MREQLRGHKDRGVHAQRERERIARSCIDVMHALPHADPDRRVKGILVQTRHRHLLDPGLDDLKQARCQIEGHRAGCRDRPQLQRQRAGLEAADPNGQDALTRPFLEQHHVYRIQCVVLRPRPGGHCTFRGAYDDIVNRHFDHRALLFHAWDRCRYPSHSSRHFPPESGAGTV
jgi:hypothetical protein